MTYIDYLNSFNAYTEWNVMSPATQVFYYKLLSVFNKAGWPEEVMLTNRQMETLIGHVSKQTVIRDRKALAAAGFIEYKGGSRGAGRYKLIEKNDSRYLVGDTNKGSAEKASQSEKTSKRFVPPTVEEVAAYCAENGYKVEADRFVDFYTAKGWYIGKTKMKDWKATVRMWHRSERSR